MYAVPADWESTAAQTVASECIVLQSRTSQILRNDERPKRPGITEALTLGMTKEPRVTESPAEFRRAIGRAQPHSHCWAPFPTPFTLRGRSLLVDKGLSRLGCGACYTCCSYVAAEVPNGTVINQKSRASIKHQGDAYWHGRS